MFFQDPLHQILERVLVRRRAEAAVSVQATARAYQVRQCMMRRRKAVHAVDAALSAIHLVNKENGVATSSHSLWLPLHEAFALCDAVGSDVLTTDDPTYGWMLDEGRALLRRRDLDLMLTSELTVAMGRVTGVGGNLDDTPAYEALKHCLDDVEGHLAAPLVLLKAESLKMTSLGRISSMDDGEDEDEDGDEDEDEDGDEGGEGGDADGMGGMNGTTGSMGVVQRTKRGKRGTGRYLSPRLRDPLSALSKVGRKLVDSMCELMEARVALKRAMRGRRGERVTGQGEEGHDGYEEGTDIGGQQEGGGDSGRSVQSSSGRSGTSGRFGAVSGDTKRAAFGVRGGAGGTVGGTVGTQGGSTAFHGPRRRSIFVGMGTVKKTLQRATLVRGGRVKGSKRGSWGV